MRCLTILLILLILMASMTGCVSSPQDARTNPQNVLTFAVNADYETVYARIVEPLRARVTPTFRNTPGLNCDMYPGKKAATISAYVMGLTGYLYPLVVDIQQVDKDQTKVRICYWGIGVWPGYARKAEGWANGR